MNNLKKLGIVFGFGLLFGLVACGSDDEPENTDAGTEAGAGGSAQGGSHQGGSAQGGSAQGGSAQGGSAQGGSAQGGSAGAGGGAGGGAGAGGGGGADCTATGTVAELRAKIGKLDLGGNKAEDFQLCGVVVTYVNKDQGFYLQDPSDKTGIYAYIKVADVAEAKVGNKINLKVTEYKRHKHPASDTGAGIYQIVKAEGIKKVEEAVDLSTLVQELKEAPKVDYVSELVKVEKLKVVSTLTNGENLTLKVDYGSAKNVVLYLPNSASLKDKYKDKTIGTFQGPVGYFKGNYQLVSEHPDEDLKGVE